MRSLIATVVTVAGLCSLAGALLIAGLLWFFAPVLLGTDRAIVQWGLAAVPPLLWIVIVALVTWRRSRRDAALVSGVAATSIADGPGHKAVAASEEDAAISRQLTEALGAMKSAAGNRGGYLYERPWYVIIGPPGAGKTTAIQNSGLEFPLAAGRVKGVGGTRNCDWWISEQAVLIDTAGRYTTQDSDQAADRAGWERFLDLLRRERPRQPLNGVIVAFGADMLSQLDEAARDENARAVRRRISELEQKLDQRLPVYFLVSKTDLVVGFAEFFDDLNKETRSQVWGMTFPETAAPAGHVGRFAEEFSALVARLQDRVLERLQAERGPEQRARIAGFPAQFASLAPAIEPFLRSAFGGSQLEQAPFLRGVYFTSGTQEGTPIDRLTGVLSRTFGLDARRPKAVRAQAGRSYFLGRLLREVVFNEARLAARDRSRERRRWALQALAWSAAVLLIAGAGGWGVSIARTEARQAEALAAAVQAAEDKAASLTFDPVSERDRAQAALPYLDSVRDLQTSIAEGASTSNFGLGQSDKLLSAAQTAYRHVLERVLLPRLLARLEGQMRGAMQRPDYLYEATRAYLMLTRQAPIIDRALLKEWMRLDWEQAVPGAVGAPARASLAAHLDTLLQGDFPRYAPDTALVEEARIVFSKLPLPERIYGRLRLSNGSAAPWRAADVIGAAGQRWFTARSGVRLEDVSVPGLYTIEGLNRVFLSRLPGAVAEAASESWIIGQTQTAALLTDPRQLEGAILRLYADDYSKAWQRVIGDVGLLPFKSLQQASEGLNVLGAPNSPIRDLIQGIARQLSPSVPLPGVAGSLQGAAQNALGGAAGAPGAGGDKGADAAAASSSAGRLASAVGAAAGPSPTAVVGQIVEDRFRALRAAAGAPLDANLALLRDVYGVVAPLANVTPGSVPPPPPAGPDPLQRLSSDARNAPEPLSRWLTVVAQSTSQLREGGAKSAITAAWRQKLAPFCRQVETRFPFSRNPGAPDMPVDDFTRLFGPGGGFDQFFDQMLAKYVDASQKPWRTVGAGGAPAPVSGGDIAQFERARAIRDAFFPGGAAGGQGLRFDMIPLGTDAAAKGATLEVEGAKTQILPGPNLARPVQLQWPARNPVILTFDPPTANPISTDGPWAALKFVYRGKLSAGRTPDQQRLLYQQGERSAEFVLRTNSVVNPFGLRELSEFRCPQFPS
ncbi:hypothetical protein GCM10007036_23550 [Alsobacter metallidurans]|uniref:Type VI secretion system protein ImpL n=1 Tax=Alsobacter metallidurans TaxID=340221 RepID=A0A917I7S1_9HYPH|nr:type VI secretion system membrane subunit TssM [Alsobacter metallidurans]GGH20159.1 hypothetical protein GCM10007036_23550 [Alsobacter metallidurans]